MKFKMLALALTMASGMVHADPTINYEAPYGHDYDAISVKVHVNSITKQKGYYWANTFTFYEGNHQGYIGLQPRAANETNLAIFSAFGNGAKSASPNCNSGADGRDYTLKIEKEEGASAGYNKWLGTITDD